jgi:hypothetical protein
MMKKKSATMLEKSALHQLLIDSIIYWISRGPAPEVLNFRACPRLQETSGTASTSTTASISAGPSVGLLRLLTLSV